MTITAKYAATCATCGGPVSAGTPIEWAKGQPVRHAICPATAGSTTLPAPQSRAITVSRIGRRSYLRGDTLLVRGLLRDGGCHWDAEARAWWVGDPEQAETLAQRARTAPAEAKPRKRITHCTTCGDALDDYQQRRGYRTCSRECAYGGQSYTDRHGRFVLGSDD